MRKQKLLRLFAAFAALLLAASSFAGCGLLKKYIPGKDKDEGPSRVETKHAGPEEGEYLYRILKDEHFASIREKAPKTMGIHIDRSGDGYDLLTDDPQAVRRLVEKFLAIRIDEESNTSVTDNYNAIICVWEDGDESYVGFDGWDYETKVGDSWRVYTLDGIDDFVAAAKELCEERTDEPEAEIASGEETEDKTEEETEEDTTEIETETTTEKETEKKTEPAKSPEDDLEIVEAETEKIRYEKFDNGLFSADVPEGWVVRVHEYADLMHYTFQIFDPENPNLKVFFNNKTEGYLSSEKERDFFKSAYPDAEMARLPYVDPQTTEAFFKVFTEAMLPNNTETFFFPVINDFTVIESIGTTPVIGGEIVRATCTDDDGEVVDGLYAASIYPVNLYYVTALNVYDTFCLTAPEGELTNWMPVLSHVFGSIEFSKAFIDGCYDQIDREARQNAEIGRICSEMTDIVISGWEERQAAYDRISQKQSDAIMGYERVYDTETGEIYRAPSDFYDNYSGSRYEPVTDDMYNQPVDGYIEYR